MRLDKIRLDGDGLVIGVDRLLVAAERRQLDTAVVVCLGEFRFQLDRLVEARERLFGAYKGPEDKALVEQNLRRRLSHLHGGGDVLQRLGRLALGELDHPHHVQGVDVIGPGQKHLPGARFPRSAASSGRIFRVSANR
jgi:hypothetical protein